MKKRRNLPGPRPPFAGTADDLAAAHRHVTVGEIGRTRGDHPIQVLTIIGTNLMNWNYMHYPFRFTMEMAADGLVASLLLGIVLAILIKPYSEVGEIDDMSGVEATPDT